jgi:hypothetical protein
MPITAPISTTLIFSGLVAVLSLSCALLLATQATSSCAAPASIARC